MSGPGRGPSHLFVLWTAFGVWGPRARVLELLGPRPGSEPGNEVIFDPGLGR